MGSADSLCCLPSRRMKKAHGRRASATRGSHRLSAALLAVEFCRSLAGYFGPHRFGPLLMRLGTRYRKHPTFDFRLLTADVLVWFRLRRVRVHQFPFLEVPPTWCLLRAGRPHRLRFPRFCSIASYSRPPHGKGNSPEALLAGAADGEPLGLNLDRLAGHQLSGNRG